MSHPDDAGAAPTATATDPAEVPRARSERLLLDELFERLDALKLFREDEQRANVILEQFGAQGRVESEMLSELAARLPLRHPDRFEEAHRSAMRALEVFDRNAARPPSSLRAGPLQPLAKVVVQLLIGVIVRSHQRRVIERLRELYARREANSVKGSPEFGYLRLARLQADRLAPGFRKSAGLPTFLIGGAAVSGTASLLQQVAVTAVENRAVLLAVGAGLTFIALAASWCVLKAAAIARRRTRIALDQPLRALWQTIGAAGQPPRDQSRQFAIIAVTAMLVVWVLVPLAVTLVFRLG